MKILFFFCLGILSSTLLADHVNTGELVKKIQQNSNNQQVLSEVYYEDLKNIEEEITTGAGANYIGSKTIDNIECTTTVNMNDDGVTEDYSCSIK